MDFSKELEIIKSGAEEIIPLEELQRKFEKSQKENKPLRVKQGIDPTSPDVHIGHMVPFKKMRQFQDMGHTGVVIIGDYTAQIGDPTGRDEERKALTHDQVKKNAEKYMEQIFKIVDRDKTEVRYQSEWFSGLHLIDIIKLASKYTLAQMLAHDTFRKRYEQGLRLSIHELFYPMLQAYDSVMVNADVELGGTDQKFNILCGRDLQKSMGQEQQIAVLMPLLMGTNGVKMSKSQGNHIAIFDKPEDKFGKVMSISDDLILNYYLYGTNKTLQEIDDIRQKLTDSNTNPRDIKLELAGEIVRIYDGPDGSKAGLDHFLNTFTKQQIPDDIPQASVSEKTWVCKVLTENGLTQSNGEARRLIKSGSLKINGEKETNIDLEIEPGKEYIIKLGKRRFLKIV